MPELRFAAHEIDFIADEGRRTDLLFHSEYRFINTFSGVNGASKAGSHSVKAIIAFRIAKYAPIPYISGGSPTALELNTARFWRVVSKGKMEISFGTE